MNAGVICQGEDKKDTVNWDVAANAPELLISSASSKLFFSNCQPYLDLQLNHCAPGSATKPDFSA